MAIQYTSEDTDKEFQVQGTHHVHLYLSGFLITQALTAISDPPQVHNHK